MVSMSVRVRGIRISGWKAVLAGFVLLVVGGVIVLLSLAALAVGVVVSVGLLCVLGLRGMLGGGVKRKPMVFEEAPQGSSAMVVREIQVDEVVVVREGRREGL